MVTIRLKPNGRTKRISYRFVVMEKRSNRSGIAIDDLGFYNPFNNKSPYKIDNQKLQKWISSGAQVSAGALKLFQKLQISY